MTKTIIALLALLGAAITTIPIYAIESTVDVPFDSWINQNCETVDNGDYVCTWTPAFIEDNTEATQPPAEEASSIAVTPEETLNEVEAPSLTREERDIQRTIDRIEQDLIDRPDTVPNAEKQLLILLKRAQDECYFGVEQGQPIQAYALFGIPKGDLYIDDTDFSKYTQLGKIAKLIEACTAWDKYRFTNLGQQYADIADAFNDAEIKLAERAAGQKLFFDAFMENITKTDEYMNRAITPHDFIQAEEDAAEFMCSIEGKQRGLCPQGIGDEEYVADTSDNPILSKYLAYKANPENVVGEPRYSVSTNPKCAILSSFITQYEISDENGAVMLKEAGCKID